MTVTVTVGQDTVTVPWPMSWTPTQLGFVARPAGPDYVRIEDLGVTLDGPGLRKAALDPRANGKILTLPPGVFSLTDYTQGSGTFAFGLMSNPSAGFSRIRGIVGSGATTVLQMTPNSSHFTSTTVSGAGSAPIQVATVMFYGVDNVEFGNLVAQGTPQPHYHHGIRINGNNAHVHHVRFLGANQGDSNSPPGETYSLMVSGANPLVEDCEFDGRRNPTAAPTATSVLAFNSCMAATVNRAHMHDLASGFGVVAWNTIGLTENDVWVDRPGTGPGGKAGSHTNLELAGGVIRINRPHVLLDEAWTNPAWGSPPKTDPTKPPARNQGHFPHFLFLQTPNGSAQTKPNAWGDVVITEPVFDPWGGVGGFAVAMDNISLAQKNFPKVVVGGTLTPVIRDTLWVDNPGFDPTKNYWVGNADITNPGKGSVWG